MLTFRYRRTSDGSLDKRRGTGTRIALRVAVSVDAAVHEE